MTLTLRGRRGRYRTWRHGVLLILVLAAGGSWYGRSGTVPLLIWWWQRRPGPAPGWWEVPVDEVRSAELGPLRVRLTFRGRAPLEIFHDELPARDLALLRRTLRLEPAV